LQYESITSKIRLVWRKNHSKSKYFISCPHYLLIIFSLLLLPLNVSSEPTGQKADDTVVAVSAPSQLPDGFESYISNSRFSLSYRNDTAEIALSDSLTGETWYSNPQDRNQKDVSSQDAARLSSQFLFYYDDTSGNPRSADSFSQCVEQKAHTVTQDDKSITVKYEVGKAEFSNNRLPEIISEERMESFFKRLTEAESDEIIQNYTLYTLDDLTDPDVYAQITATYPSVKKHNIYVRRNFPEYIGEELFVYFEKAKYTVEELRRDCEENSVAMMWQEPFGIVLEIKYSLTENGFEVLLNPRDFKWSSAQPITNFVLLPYFGCGSDTDKGFMFVPDGSGSIINFNNGKTQSQTYWKSFFEADRSIQIKEKNANEELSLLPVFGIERNGYAFAASVDSGYECGGVTADISGKQHPYNYVSAFFNPLPKDTVSINGDTNINNNTIRYQKQLFSGSIKLSYLFSDDASPKGWSAMAVLYRDHLTELGVLTKKSADKNVMSFEFTATALEHKNFLGFHYSALTGITTFENAQTILKNKFDGADIRWTGAVNGGISQSNPATVKFESVTGGKKEFFKLKSGFQTVYVGLNLTEVSKAPKNRSSRSLGRDTVKLYDYDFISRYYNFSKSFRMILSPSYYGTLIKKTPVSLKKQGIDAVFVNDIITQLNSDFNEVGAYDRGQVREETQKLLDALHKNVRLSGEKGSVYSLPYIDKIWSLPSGDSGYDIENYAVPFYAMVIHGNIPYCLEPTNESPDSQKLLLTAAEMGAGLQYTWIFKNPEDPVNLTEMFFNRRYTESIEQAKEYSEKLEPLFEKVKQALIHEIQYITSDLHMVKYDNGVTVYVNYSGAPVEINGVSVPEKDFIFS